MLKIQYPKYLEPHANPPPLVSLCQGEFIFGHFFKEDHDGIVPVSAIHSTHACFKAPYLIIALKENLYNNGYSKQINHL